MLIEFSTLLLAASHAHPVFGMPRSAYRHVLHIDPTIGDTLDWINPSWLLAPQARSDPTMVAARRQIISTANSRGTNQPWCQCLSFYAHVCS